MCSTGEPAVSASTCEPAALPAAVPVEVMTTPSERGHARIGVGHVHGAGFAARRDEADAALARDRVEDRHVVDRDHAEGGGDAHVGERARDGVADRFGFNGGSGGGAFRR